MNPDFLPLSMEQNPTEQAAPHPYQPSFLDNFHPPSPLELPENPIGPIMTSYMNLTPQNTAHMKEYSINKPMPFSGDQTKIKAFLQECLVYIDMNEDVYVTDKLKIGFVLSYMTEKELKDWREIYLEDIKDPATEKLVYPTFSTFLTEVCKAFQSTDHIQDAMYKLENLKQGKKLAEQVVTESKQLVGQAGLTTKSTSDNIHLIGLFRRALNFTLTHKIIFGEVIPRKIDDWFKKAIQFDTNWQEAMAIFGPNTNKKNENKMMNRTWYKPAEKKDPNTMDVDALTFKERQTLMNVSNADEEDKKGKKKEELKKVDPVRNAYNTIRGLTKDERDQR